MGDYFIDQYSLLHFAVGIVAYFFGFNFKFWFWLHAFFELVENLQPIMNFTNNLGFWPGGKYRADSLINRFGDQVFAIIGWYLAFYIDSMGNKYGWYEPHRYN